MHRCKSQKRALRLLLLLLGVGPLAVLLFSLLSSPVIGLRRKSDAYAEKVGKSVTREQCAETLRVKAGMGFAEATLDAIADNVVLMLFSENATAKEAEEEEAAGEPRFACEGDCTGFEKLQRRFDYVAKDYLRPRFSEGATADSDFFQRHSATLWSIDKDETTGRWAASPLVIDVVYTHVNNSSPSHEAALRACGVWQAGGMQNRFHDWGELRYALRSLHWYALERKARHHRKRAYAESTTKRQYAALDDMGFTVDRRVDASGGLVFRHVYLVLADRDQLPEWLNESAFPQLRVVTHAELFSAEEAKTALPTLNSLAIESVLHRIPGISRFFWYFNNDMMIGRPVSAFDLFRPLSPSRQALRFSSFLKRGLSAWGENAVPESLTGNEPVHMLFLEPVLHADGQLPDDALVDTRPVAAFEETPRSAVAPVCVSTEAARCERLRSDKLVAAQCLANGLAFGLADSAGRPAPLRTTPFWFSFKPPMDVRDYLNNDAHRLIMERVEGVLPTSTYSHVPLLVDRRIMSFALDGSVPDSFADDAAVVRRSFVRKPTTLSPVHLYTPLVLALRRARDVHLWSRHRPPPPPPPSLTTPQPAEGRGQGRFANPAARVLAAELRPLCGHSFSIQQQHPMLLKHLSSWAGLESDTGLTDSVFLARERNESTICGAEAFPVRLTVERRSDGSDNSQYLALYADLFHHTADGTARFIMMQDPVRLGISLALVKRFYAAGTPVLFTTVNDDIGEEMVQQMMSPKHRAYMEDFFAAAVSYAPPAPWERQA